ncbi:MAG: hypothetical protein IJD56_08890 [Peptococcaceae bacterium]|nr:hypothetical protein [Peptococcaceae bacterium]
MQLFSGTGGAYTVMTTLEIVSYVLILVSAVFKGIALMNLNNKKREFEISKKLYTKFNIVSYLLLVPGVILFVYCNFL